MNSKDVGERSEAMVMAALLRSGKVVLQPFGDNQRYDLVVDDGGGKFSRIQVKTGKLKAGIIEFSTCSSYAHRGRGRKGYNGECEFFCMYCPQLDKVYIIPVDETPSGSCRFRISKPRGGVREGTKFAVDYELKADLVNGMPDKCEMVELTNRDGVCLYTSKTNIDKCPVCGDEKKKSKKYCSNSCRNIIQRRSGENSKRKVERPSYETLKSDIENLGYSGTGRKYGVSDNAIRKWMKNYKIDPG